MKMILQRVNKASLVINGHKITSISKGFLLYVGIAKSDSDIDIEKIIDKTLNLRIFENKHLKFDTGIRDVNGEILVISQFTLFAEYSKGRRPFFGSAEESKRAKKMYHKFISVLKNKYNPKKVKTGIFAAYMKITCCNDGPVTLILDSKAL